MKAQNGYQMFDGHKHTAKWLSNVWQTDDTSYTAAIWLSNVRWTDTQPNGYQMLDRQMTHHTVTAICWLSNVWWTDTQPNGCQMLDRQTCGQIAHSQMVIKCWTDRWQIIQSRIGYQMFYGQTHCLTDRHWPNDRATWLSNVWQTDNTAYTAKWLSNVWWTDRMLVVGWGWVGWVTGLE